MINERGKMELNREELAWAAGFLDGEGSFLKQKDPRYNHVQMSVCAAQVRKEPLDRLANILGGKVSGPYGPYKQQNKQPHYRWVVTSYEKVQDVTARLWLFLSEPKKEQAEKMIIAVRNYQQEKKKK